jgi:hemerythrin
MNLLHRNFLERLSELDTAADGDFVNIYASFVAYTEHAFATEEQWIGFPGLKGHREQHARVLSTLHHLHAHAMKGDLALGRKIVQQLLPQWFILHRLTLDTVLANAMLVTSNFDYAQPGHLRWSSSVTALKPHLSGQIIDRNISRQ